MNEYDKELINSTGNKDSQTIILFMETPELDKTSLDATTKENLLEQSVSVKVF